MLSQQVSFTSTENNKLLHANAAAIFCDNCCHIHCYCCKYCDWTSYDISWRCRFRYTYILVLKIFNQFIVAAVASIVYCSCFSLMLAFHLLIFLYLKYSTSISLCYCIYIIKLMVFANAATYVALHLCIFLWIL